MKQAKWIGMADRKKQGSMPVFQKEFEIGKPVQQAVVRITGLGHYDWTLNGNRMDDYELEPGWTNPDKSVYYRTHDIREGLQKGTNTIRIRIGNGMYNVEGGRYAKFIGTKGEPGCWMELCLQYQDGTTERVVTDETWQVSEGSVTFSCVFGGEDQNGLWTPEWKQAVEIQGPKGTLIESIIPPMRVQEVYPGECRTLEDGTIYYDTQQNLSGFFRIQAAGSKGAKLRVWPYELIRHGKLEQFYSGTPHYYEYTFSGEDVEEWRPAFTYYGFRYLKLEVLEGTCEIHKVEGLMVYPDITRAGDIQTDNELINGIHRIINQAMLSNIKSVFTDCPHREKLGWLEEVHLMGPSLLYNYHVEPIMQKTIRDMQEAQLENGLVPDIAPEFVEFGGGFRDSCEWGSACIIVPWYLYRITGDNGYLEEAYPMMERYLSYLKKKTTYHTLHHGLGDWCDFGLYADFPQNTPVAPVATAIYYYDLVIMEQICQVLDKDGAIYQQEKKKVKQAYNREFYERGGHRYSTGSQTSHALPLFMELVPEEEVPVILEKLVRDVELRGDHMTGGDIGYPFLLRTLDKFDHQEIPARMLLHTEAPSYGFQVLNGATTLCENWDGNRPEDPRNSQNHFMLGSVEEWLFHGLAGFKRFHETGASEILLKPYFMPQLNHLKAWHDYPQGRVSLEWQRTADGRIELMVEVPDDAVLILPDDIPSGKSDGTPDGVKKILTCGKNMIKY